uniref:Cytoplasmic tRNA 2-thiolation protein 2 n=1 Tax=Syphacia muris TaxID=451379 RepID=A0A0N5AKL3_9BILA
MVLSVNMKYKQCVKCGQPGTLSGVDPKKAIYCKSCFIASVKHKFASAIGKRRIFKDGQRKAIIVYEGNQESAFLISQIAQSLSAGNKRLTIEPTVVVLVTATDEESINKVTSAVCRFQEILKCQWFFVHVALVLDSIKLNEANAIAGLNLVEKYKGLLDSCSDVSVRMELTSLLKDLLLIRIARFLNIDKILVPDCADVLARKVLSSFCFARAASVACMTGAVDVRFDDVIILRPIRDICLKEIAIINRFEGSDSYVILTETAHLRDTMEKSVQSATTNFFYEQLNEGFKGVLNTVLSTSSKLKLPTDNKNRCLLCYSMFLSLQAERFCHGCSLIFDEVGEKDVIEEVLLMEN